VLALFVDKRTEKKKWGNKERTRKKQRKKDRERVSENENLPVHDFPKTTFVLETIGNVI